MARTNAKLSEAAKKKAYNRHNWALQWCWNYERMQAAGYAYAMVPVIKELYDTEEAQCRELERHMQFYNTHPGASALIFGADVALEEGYETEVGDNLKVALMGPLAGIGDTISAVLLGPPFSIMAASLANEAFVNNSIAQGWLAVLVNMIPSAITFFLRWPLERYAYKQGVNVIKDVSGAGSLDVLQTVASILGVVVAGGFIPSMIGAKIPLKIGSDLVNEQGEVVKEARTVQEVLDAIFPYLVPIVLVGLAYWLLKKKKQTPLRVILYFVIFGFILGALGVIG